VSIEEAYELVERQKPDVLYLSGKTSTGKSTFAKKLQADLGFRIVELDQVVRQSVIEPLGLTDEGRVFAEIYRHRAATDWLRRFLEGAKQTVAHTAKQGKGVIVEGALSNPFTLAELLATLPTATFLYFHPASLATYERNLRSRFKTSNEDHRAGLPNSFWELINPASFTQYCKDRRLTPELSQAIRRYAETAQTKSKTRLAAFQNQFDNIYVIEV
jgi:guanylate kinase